MMPLKAIAHEALARKAGARGLPRAIIEGIMKNVMYEVPSRDDVEKCIVTKDVVTAHKEPELVLKKVDATKKHVKMPRKRKRGSPFPFFAIRMVKQMSEVETMRLPLLALRGLIVFPGMIINLDVGRIALSRL